MEATFTIIIKSDRSDPLALQADFIQLRSSLESAARAVTGSEATVLLDPVTFTLPYHEDTWRLQQCVDGHISVTAASVAACPKCGKPLVASTHF